MEQWGGSWIDSAMDQYSEGALSPSLSSPDDMEGSGYDQFIVEGNAHVAGLMESRGHRPGGIAQETPPE